MHGPPLTPQEAVASVARQVRRHEALGLGRDQAIKRAAAENGIEPEKVRWCAASSPGGTSASPVDCGQGDGYPRRRHGERRQRSIPAHKENTMRTAPGSRRQRPRTRLAVAFAALAAGALALTSAANAQAATVNVNPVTGKDTNSGTATKPLKTLTRALSKVRAGDTVKLAGGGYGPGASGDQFPQSGLPVRAGVTIEGATDAGFPVATLLGPGNGAALNLAGNATVRNLTWGGQGFGIGLYAKQGTQTLSNLFIAMPPGASANVDGFTLDGGIFLRGSAQATLKGSKIFLLSGDATGVNVNEQAHFTMDGGTITGGDQPNCRTGAFGIELNQAAQATLSNINNPGFQNLAGSALAMRGTSKATLSHSLLLRELTAACQPAPSIDVNGSAALTTQSATQLVQSTSDGTKVGTGIQMGSSAPLKLQGSIGGYDRGLQVIAGGTGSLTLDNASVSGCRVCVDARGATGPIAIANSSLTAGSTKDSVGIIAPSLKMRNTLVSDNSTGILVTGAGADLGTASDPGNNTIRLGGGFPGVTGVTVPTNVVNSTISAVGNTWNPGVQGADSSGRYPTPIVVTGQSPLARGLNFNVAPALSSSGVKIVLGPGAAVGTFRLSPRTLTARAGRAASWRLTWTHPLGWKRLDQIELRLESRGKPVGRIVLDQQTRRLRASGAAVRLVAGRSAVAGGGKRLTARLTLRIAKRYAGRTLVARLAARDDNGSQQGWRKAGRVRVVAH